MAKNGYNEYINSDAWKLVREDAFLIHGRYCAKCRTTKRLHVHHKTYKRFKKERVDIDLIPLCESCHDKCNTFCKHKKMNLWHGTEAFLLNTFAPSKIKRGKLTKKQRRALRRERRRAKKRALLSRPIKPPSRAASVPLIEQMKRLKSFSAPREKPKMAIDVQKMMKLYGIDEETARSVL